ncbi:MAG: AAA family ATPase [Nanoarchaeota archaeon]
MSFISRAVNLKEEGILKEIYLWIKNNILIVISDGPFEEFDKNDTAEFIYNNSKYKEKIMELLESCDLGIVDLEVKKKSEEDIPIDLPKKFHKYLMTEFDIKFIHEQENGNKIERISFDYNEESSGTQKIFDIAGSILDSLENNKVLFIDELEKSLHPLLMEHIVKIFNGKKNKNSQLIFTTHNTELLDLNILRRDQIWFMEKDPNKDTSLISIFDFKGIRKDLDIKKAYYSGRFGAIPITTDNYN